MTNKKAISSNRVPKGDYENGLAEWNKHVSEVFDASMHNNNQKYYQGQIPKKLIIKLTDSLKNCDKALMELDCNDGFVYSHLGMKTLDSINKNFDFFDFQEPQLEIVKEMCEFMKADITKHFGCPFRVMNIRMSRATPETSPKVGSNTKHIDGDFPKGTHKILIYLNGASIAKGFTRIRGKHQADITGPSGTYLLFNPCITYHQGRPPTKGIKDLLEVTLCPWHETILEPVCGGPNSRHPIRP